jgi:putative endonuclease
MASEKGDGRGGRGKLGESAAQDFLEKQGYRIVDTNVRFGRSSGLVGEIDIVAWDDRTLCFVEVKTRRGAPGSVFPADSITLSKQRQVARLGLAYASRNGLLADDAEVALRFDVIEIFLGSRTKESNVIHSELWRGAFAAPEDFDA